MSTPSPFQSRTVVIVAIVALASLLAATLVGVFGEPKPPITAQANAFSKSAIGHHAFVALLERAHIPVLVSRWRSERRAQEGAVLALLEPLLESPADPLYTKLYDMVASSEVSFVVLPKRYGEPDDEEPMHLETAGFISLGQVDLVLEALRVDGFVVRASEPPTWTTSPFEPDPAAGDLQLIVSGDLEPLIDSAEGTLLGRAEVAGRTVYLLSDPDIIATHGLITDPNPALSLAIVNLVRAPGRTLVVDETLHGFELRPSLSRELMRFPLVFLVVQAVLLVFLVVWSGLSRFGAPIAEDEVRRDGQRALIENSALVLDNSIHGGHTLARYLQMTTREVQRALKAPSLRDQAARVEWLRAAGRTRKVSIDLGDLEERVRLLLLENKVESREAVLLALRMNLWKREMLNGPQLGTRNLPKSA